MKKTGLFLFALGMSAAFGLARAGGGDPSCYAACDYKYDACTSTPAICAKVHAMCYERCDMESGF